MAFHEDFKEHMGTNIHIDVYLYEVYNVNIFTKEIKTMNELQVLFKSNNLIKAKYDFTVAQNRLLQKVFYEIQKNKNNIAEISTSEMKQLEIKQ